ncbi:MAG: DUF2267 domain-containing protein [Planctomycetota bacterium]|jgi:uncharacterized protein (DUF2267 family)
MPYGVENFESTIQKTRGWLWDVMRELGVENERQAFAAVKAVLHVLRDRLTVEESAQLAAQLPMLLRGLYYEGWRPARAPEKIRHIGAFVERVRENLRAHPEIDPEKALHAVFKVLSTKVSEGELKDIRHNLSRELEEILPVGEKQGPG